MSMVDVLLNILFILSSLEVAQTVPYSTIVMVKKLVVKKWEPQIRMEYKLKSIEV